MSQPKKFDFLDQSFGHRAEWLEKTDWVIGKAVLPLPTAPINRPSEPGASYRQQPKQLAEEIDPTETATIIVECGGRKFQIRGTVISCGCPDCHALMSVRIWLGLAECWRCQCSIALEREELAVLRERLKPAVGTVAPVQRIPTPDDLLIPAPQSRLMLVPKIQTDGKPDDVFRPDRDWSFLGWLPAWLISFLLHLILIVLLALIMFSPSERDPKWKDYAIELVLSPFVSDLHKEGGPVRVEPDAVSDVENPVTRPSPDGDTGNEADLADAREIRRDSSPLGDLPSLDVQRQRIQDDGGSRAALVARDPRLREEIVYREGGTSETEAAVARGLRWLASVQNQDGSWSLANYARHKNSRNTGDAAGTGLALLPFLGAGQTQEYGIYKETVARGLRWLLDNQAQDGDLRADFPGQAGMYAHGQCAIVLCEAYALTGDEQLRIPAQRAIDFIVESQHMEGGWRYFPGQEGDTSVFGWQLMALQSARETGVLSVSTKALERAESYLDRVSVKKKGDPVSESGVLYRYQPREDVTAAMTAEAILCRMYLGWKRDDPRLMRAIQWLVDEHPPTLGDADVYYWYYATQAIHHFGGGQWQEWNSVLRELLVSTQSNRGAHPGSWDPNLFEWGSQGGRIFTTSFAVCTLEVYYRRLPLFRNLELDRTSDE